MASKVLKTFALSAVMLVTVWTGVDDWSLSCLTYRFSRERSKYSQSPKHWLFSDTVSVFLGCDDSWCTPFTWLSDGYNDALHLEQVQAQSGICCSTQMDCSGCVDTEGFATIHQHYGKFFTVHCLDLSIKDSGNFLMMSSDVCVVFVKVGVLRPLSLLGRECSPHVLVKGRIELGTGRTWVIYGGH